nr:hypothetical protein B0A51_01725 [Rachicladosporium sp. CCFEE 5018]
MDNPLYDNTHRAFLQALLASQTLTFPQAQTLLAKIQTAADPSRPVPPNDILREEFTSYITALNEAISAFDFEIRSTLHQTRAGEEVWALANVQSDSVTQMATHLGVEELGFLRRVLDRMFETNNTQAREVMAVTGQEALQCARVGSGRESGVGATQGEESQARVVGITQVQAEKVLAGLVKEGWFEESRKGWYSLSPRALMELRGWLVDTYNDPPDEDGEEDEEEARHQNIKFCAACKGIVTVGQRCPDQACAARLHDHCVGKMWAAQGRREECPSCKKEWKEPGMVGEKAARRGRPSAGAGAARPSNGRRRTSGMNTDGAADEESSDD